MDAENSSYREFEVSDELVERAREMGLFGNVRGRIKKMAHYSTPYTHPRGNRRFGEFVLTVGGGRVVSIEKIGVGISMLAGDNDPVPCPDCDGDGGFCLTCNHTGVVTRGLAAELARIDAAVV